MKVFATKLYPVIIILFASFLVVIPHIYTGFPWGHSIIFNSPWHQYFSDQFLNGEIYPRWLYDYLDGFGAPVFYFYAPLPFYLLSFIELIFGDIKGDFLALTLGHISLFFLSGIAFYKFISQYLDKYWSTIFSVSYIFLPYHYIDIEVRAALGESLAYVWIPLIMMGLCKPKKTLSQLIFSGKCYAGLILSHLPSALLVIPAIIIFSLFSTRQSHWVKSIGYALFIGILGVTASAIYILPAIFLQNTLPYDAWVTGSGSHFKLENWLIGNSNINWFGISVYKALAAPSLLGIGAAIIFYLTRDRQAKSYNHISYMILASLSTLLLSWMLMLNISQPIWENFPVLYKVQFPWRLGVVTDFCSLLLISLSVPRIFAYLKSKASINSTRTTLLLQSVFISIVLVIIAFSVVHKYFPKNTVNTIEDIGKEVYSIEYRPKWVVESQVYLSTGNIDDLSDINLARELHDNGIQRWESYVKYYLPTISTQRVLDKEESITINNKERFTTSISATVKSPTTIRIKKIYYPHWKLTDQNHNEINVYPDPQTGLILFDLLPGEYVLTLDKKNLPSEKIGILISFITITIILGWMIFSFYVRRVGNL